MPHTTLHIKNMVCNRCIKVIRDEFSKLNVQIESIELGKMTLKNQPDSKQYSKIQQALHENGFELIGNKKSRIIEQIKTTVINLIHHQQEKEVHINLSDFISKEVGFDYSYLSNLFSSVEGITIGKYIINQKIEKVKELLVYNELTLNEISHHLGYSSVQHLSSQFRKITGLTPSHFKKLRENKREPLDFI